MGIYDETTRFDLVQEARLAWDALYDWRTRRARTRNYFRNKPNETTKDVNGYTVFEDDVVSDQGRIPLHLSRMGKIINNLQGQYRSINMQRMAYGRNREDNEAADQMTEALRAANDVNEAQELDAAEILEMIIGGLYGWKNTFPWVPRWKRNDVYIQNIDGTRFFYNADMSDVRTHDMYLCGELHDISLDDLIAQFAKTPEDEERIRKLCIDNKSWAASQSPYVVGFNSRDTMSFYQPVDNRKNRVIELWKVEYAWNNFLIDHTSGKCEVSDMSPDQVNVLNRMREDDALKMGLTPPPPIEQEPKYEQVWKVYFLTPQGNVLFSGQTPYDHENNPYTIGFAETLDGEVWGPGEEMIEPQRHINRINSMIDYAIGTAAKGVLLVPDDCIPAGMTIDDIAAEWSRFGGVIKFTPRPDGKMPEQVVQNAIPEGIFTWLQNMYNDMREMSGVQEANMGTAPMAGTPATSYIKQIEMGQITNRKFFDSFFAVRRRRDLKTVQLIAQYYNTVTMISVSGKRADGSKFVTYDPSRIRDIEWDLIVTEASDTPTTRQQMEEFLLGFLNANRITFGQYLQMSSHPKADLMMNIIQKTNPLLADTKIGMQQYAALKMQLEAQAQGGNMDAIALLQQAA
jgi:hypothetical protein